MNHKTIKLVVVVLITLLLFTGVVTPAIRFLKDSSTYIELDSNLGMTAYPMTIAFWCKKEVATMGSNYGELIFYYQEILSLSDKTSNTRYIAIEINPDRIQVSIVGQNHVYDYDFSYNKWYFIAIVFTSGTNRVIYIYDSETKVWTTGAI